MILQTTLHPVPGLAVNDRLVESGIILVLMRDLTNVDRVLQDDVKLASAECAAAERLANPERGCTCLLLLSSSST